MRVSIVINNYNYEEFVGRAVESALHQTHADVEVVVIDDGSQDNSVATLGAYAGVTTLVCKTNGGQGSAYNTGLQHSTGDIIIFLDADDWLYPEAAAEVVAVWQTGVVKAQFRLSLVDRDGEPLGRHVPRSMHDREALELVRNFGAYGSPPGSGNAFSAEFLRQVLPMDESRWRTAADTVPILLAPMYGTVISLPKTLGAYRIHRRTSGEDLLLNNAPEGLWQEYARIESTKRFVEGALKQRAASLRKPLLLAPWECRIAALCVRFGGQIPNGLVCSKRELAWSTLGSLWRWPLWGWTRKLLLSAWIVLVLSLPRGVAWRLARRHRSSIGVPVPALR
jgi:Glycosyl transferase family 2